MIDYDRLVELLDLYEDGCFINRFSRGRAKAGNRAGYQDEHGYRRILLDGVKYYEHHLVWFYIHGIWPDELDHKDGDRSNNAPSNLRLSTRSQNVANSDRPTGISGLKGAYLDRRTMHWFSKIQLGMQTIWLGTFDTAEEAAQAYAEAAERYHGEFAFHNRQTPEQEAI